MYRIGLFALGVSTLLTLTPVLAEGCDDIDQVSAALETAEGLTAEDRERATLLRNEAFALCQADQEADAIIRIEEAKGLLGLT